jgi:hypothetical protein
MPSFEDFYRKSAERELEKMGIEESSNPAKVEDDLSLLIPDAPRSFPPVNREALKSFSSLDTNKISDLIEKRQELTEYFKDKMVIDLGAGSSGLGLMASEVLSSRGYIAVEPFNGEELAEEIKSRLNKCKHVKEVCIAETDMLTFLKGMPSQLKDITVLVSGIDFVILGTHPLADDREKQDKYLDDIRNELKRCVGQDSYLIMYSSFEEEKNDGFITVKTLSAAEGEIFVLEPLHKQAI